MKGCIYKMVPWKIPMINKGLWLLRRRKGVKKHTTFKLKLKMTG